MKEDVKKVIKKMREQPGKVKDNFSTFQPKFDEKKAKTRGS